MKPNAKSARRQLALLGRAVRSYLIEHPDTTPGQAIDATGCKIRTFYYQKAKLVREGIIPFIPSPGYVPNSANTPRNPDDPRAIRQVHPEAPPILARQPGDLTAAEALAEVAEHNRTVGKDAEPLTIEESLQILARFARKAKEAGDLKGAKEAVMAHATLTARTATKELGPKPPLTDADKIARMTVLCDVVGPQLVAAAILAAYPVDELTQFEGELVKLKATRAPTGPLAPTVEMGPLPLTSSPLIPAPPLAVEDFNTLEPLEDSDGGSTQSL